MLDQYQRTIDYMRISLTDRCNLHCKYCIPRLPVQKEREIRRQEILSCRDILMISEAAAENGITHIKLTGGEPLLYPGLEELTAGLKKIKGIETVTMTTNGILLKNHLIELKKAGIDGINISLDTLDPGLYKEITGTDGLSCVMDAVEEACRLGIQTKINAVSLRIEEEKIRKLAFLAEKMPVDIRFIEIMPIGSGKGFPSLSHAELEEKMDKWFPGRVPDDRKHGNGPACYYRIPGFAGCIGMISAIHGKFCASCNRIRLTSDGRIKTCLCYSPAADLKGILSKELTRQEKRKLLSSAIRAAVQEKQKEHCFDDPASISEENSMKEIGG